MPTCIGEHGDSEVLAWSQATIAGLSLDEFAKVHGKPLTGADRQQIDENVRRAAYHIIAGKGATYYGIGSAVARIVDVLLHDQRAILTICCAHHRRAGLRRRDAGACRIWSAAKARWRRFRCRWINRARGTPPQRRHSARGPCIAELEMN